MSVGVSSAILASIVALTVAIAILTRRPRRSIYNAFAAFSFSLFLWHAASVAMPFLGADIDALQRVAALAIPPTAIAFFLELLRDQGLKRRAPLRLALALSTGLLLLEWTPLGGSWAVRATIAGYVFGALALVLQALLRRMRKAKSDTDRKRLSYLFYGGLVALLLAASELVPGAELTASMGHVAATFYLYFLYQSVVTQRLLDVVEFLGKALVLAMLTFVLAAIYALLVLWVGSGKQGLWFFHTLVASFVILILYDQLRPPVEDFAGKLLFRERYELNRVVGNLIRALRRTTGLESMRERVLETLSATGRFKRIAIYLADESGMVFQLVGHRGDPPLPTLSLTEHPSLIQEVRRERRPLSLEQLNDRWRELPSPLAGADATVQRELERTSETMTLMRTLGVSLVLPMVVEERLHGLVAVGSDTSAGAFSTEEIAALLSVAEACAVVIENSREYEKRRERDRLVALGEMAAGMAHEIRNPLGAIKGAAQCIDPAIVTAEAGEFLGVIVEEVDRLNGVVSQFLEYARPYRGAPMPTDVNAVVSATVRLLGNEAIPDRIRLVQNLAHGLPQVSVDPEQLKQVLINLVLNAVQALPQQGQITIGTHHARAQPGSLTAIATGESGHVVLSVHDDGVGISPEDLGRVFVPFFTTKPKGTGLGLAVSQRIIENSGGTIGVASRAGEGTTFSVRLPALPAVQERRDTAPDPLPAATPATDPTTA